MKVHQKGERAIPTEYQKYFKTWFRNNFQILRLVGFSKFTQTEDAWKADMEQAYIAGIRKGIKLSKENINV